MNRATFQEICSLRRRDAAALLAARQFSGAYYLTGYAVECALKACIAKQVRRYDFPDRDLVNKAYTHKLEALLSLSGLKPDLEGEMRNSKALELHWAIVKDWSESSRYELGITERKARDMYSATTARRHGVLTWIRPKFPTVISPSTCGCSTKTRGYSEEWSFWRCIA